MERLLSMKCVACRGGEPTATPAEIAEYQLQLPEWTIVERHGVPQLERVFKFRNFKDALAFTNRVGELAEAENHHPALLTQWGSVTVSWWTHVLKGLHRNDFIMATKTDSVYLSS